MRLPTASELDFAAQTVYRYMPPTPQHCWPQLCARLGTEVWVKHENHTSVGAFKVRGAYVYFTALAAAGKVKGVIAATRGNHGQAVGVGAALLGLPAIVVVPHGNSPEKNAAMRAYGVQLVEHGDDFQAARRHAEAMAHELNLHMVPSFHPCLVSGAATAGLELLRAVGNLETVYVPIGLGSGICGMVAARQALGLRTRIVGVVSTGARAYAASFAAQEPISSPATTRLADGIACSTPDGDALDIILRQVDRIVEVTDDEIAEAIRILFSSTHNCAEGAGAAALAAAIQEGPEAAGSRIGVVLSGGNIDRQRFAEILLKS